MNTSLIHDAIQANEKPDADHLERLNDRIAEILENGFCEYFENGKKEKLTFDTVISEGCDTKGFIPAMLEFVKCWKSIHTAKEYDEYVAIIFIEEVESLLTSFIEAGIIEREDRPEKEPE